MPRAGRKCSPGMIGPQSQSYCPCTATYKDVTRSNSYSCHFIINESPSLQSKNTCVHIHQNTICRSFSQLLFNLCKKLAEDKSALTNHHHKKRQRHHQEQPRHTHTISLCLTFSPAGRRRSGCQRVRRSALKVQRGDNMKSVHFGDTVTFPQAPPTGTVGYLRQK